MKQKQEQMKKMTEHIEQHKKAILFGFFHTMQDLSVTQVDFESQDNNRTKAIISFQDEKKVIYDNGSLELEQGFGKYITWFNQNILKNRKLYCKNILAYTDCGFVEYINSSECLNEEQKEAFYYRLGSLNALILSLQGMQLAETDVTMMQEQPVIQDVGALLKKKPVYSKKCIQNMSKRKEDYQVISDQYPEYIQKGYSDTCDFIMENENDIQEIIKLCFR